MGCKHCSFKSYCIQPWIPSITSCKMVTKKKEEKNTSPSVQAGPPGGCPAGPAAASPSPRPSQLRPAGGYTPAPHRPRPSGFAHTRRSRSRARASSLHRPSRPERRDQMAKFQAGPGPAAPAAPRPPAPAWPALARPAPGPGAGSVDGAPLAPTHPSRTWFSGPSPGRARGGETPRAGREQPRHAPPRAHAPARPPVGRRLAAWARLPGAGHLAAPDAVATGVRGGARRR